MYQISSTIILHILPVNIVYIHIKPYNLIFLVPSSSGLLCSRVAVKSYPDAVRGELSRHVFSPYLLNTISKLLNATPTIKSTSSSLPQLQPSLTLSPFLSLTSATMASNRKRLASSSDNNDGILSRVSSTVSESAIVQKGKQFASDGAYIGKKLIWSTGKALWIAGTTLLILGVPLLIEAERDQQLTDLELQQASLLGTPPVVAPQK